MNSKSTVNFLKKITTKEIGFNVRALEDMADKSHDKIIPVMQVIGAAQAYSVQSNQLGDKMVTSCKFEGQFEATNLLSKVVYRSKTLFVPDVASTIVEGILLSAGVKEGVKDGPMTPIAIEVGVKYRESDRGTRFQFTAKSLLPETGSYFDNIRRQIEDQSDEGPAKKK